MSIDTTVSFQKRVAQWMHRCFGPPNAEAKAVRVRRFLEEANELAQSLGVSKADALELVNYTWGREPGVPRQEVGGVKVTLAAVCEVHELGYEDDLGEEELRRINTSEMVEKIRAKQASKPAGGNLPTPWPRNNPWAEAIDEARVAACLSPTTPQDDPVKSLAELIEWQVKVALDPAVSEDACKLIERGREEWSGMWKRPDHETVSAFLLLVGYDVPEAVIATWDDVKTREAYEWAVATHLRASDNDGPVRHKPRWLPEPWNGPMDGPEDSVLSTNPTPITE